LQSARIVIHGDGAAYGTVGVRDFRRAKNNTRHNAWYAARTEATAIAREISQPF
jgi:hypothetical protein